MEKASALIIGASPSGKMDGIDEGTSATYCMEVTFAGVSKHKHVAQLQEQGARIMSVLHPDYIQVGCTFTLYR